MQIAFKIIALYSAIATYFAIKYYIKYVDLGDKYLDLEHRHKSLHDGVSSAKVVLEEILILAAKTDKPNMRN